MGNLGKSRSALLLILGSIVMIAGCALTFLTVDVSEEGRAAGLPESIVEPQSGFDTGDSSTYVLFGVIAIICGIIVGVSKKSGARKAAAVIGLLAGLVSLYAGYVDATAASDALPAEFSGFAEAKSGVGTYVVILGALLVTIGGALGFKGPDTHAVADHVHADGHSHAGHTHTDASTTVVPGGGLSGPSTTPQHSGSGDQGTPPPPAV